MISASIYGKSQLTLRPYDLWSTTMGDYDDRVATVQIRIAFAALEIYTANEALHRTDFGPYPISRIPAGGIKKSRVYKRTGKKQRSYVAENFVFLAYNNSSQLTSVVGVGV